jgi:hypothetical protein
MDTKFWGPSGWKLLHSLTFTYEPRQREAMSEWLATLPYVLPCKFCRASLTDYFREDDPDAALQSQDSLARFMWRIHGRVNEKLRGQGQTIPKDPTFKEIEQHYLLTMTRQPRECESFPGWDFLFSIAYNHPLGGQGKPMPDAAPKDHSDEELNKWNMLPPQRRFKYWRRFWELLPAVMPKVWADAWTKTDERPCLQNKRSAVAWLWRIRCGFSHGADPYRVVCSRLASYASGCGKSSRARTCRRLVKRRKTKRTKRQ